jgi:hypothetical protein
MLVANCDSGGVNALASRCCMSQERASRFTQSITSSDVIVIV